MKMKTRNEQKLRIVVSDRSIEGLQQRVRCLTWMNVPASATTREILRVLRALTEALELRALVEGGSPLDVLSFQGKDRFVCGDGPVRVALGVMRKQGYRDLFSPPLTTNPIVPLVPLLQVGEALIRKYYPEEFASIVNLENEGFGVWSAAVGREPLVEVRESCVEPLVNVLETGLFVPVISGLEQSAYQTAPVALA